MVEMSATLVGDNHSITLLKAVRIPGIGCLKRALQVCKKAYDWLPQICKKPWDGLFEASSAGLSLPTSVVQF